MSVIVKTLIIGMFYNEGHKGKSDTQVVYLKSEKVDNNINIWTSNRITMNLAIHHKPSNRVVRQREFRKT